MAIGGPPGGTGTILANARVDVAKSVAGCHQDRSSSLAFGLPTASKQS